jgi:hypothetical protein
MFGRGVTSPEGVAVSSGASLEATQTQRLRIGLWLLTLAGAALLIYAVVELVW